MSENRQKDSIGYDGLRVWMREIDKKLDNHLVHTASDIAQIKTDMSWLKQFFWIVMGVSVTAVLGAFFMLIIIRLSI